MMGAHTNWVDISALEGRLDSRYYSATATTSRARVRSYGATKKLGKLCRQLDCGPFGSTLTEDEHDPAGDVVLVQPTDITAPLFTSEPGWRIARATQQAKSLKPYPADTVFFARVGIYPHTGVLPKHLAGSTISSKIIAAVVNEEKADPYFLHSFLRSQLGQTILVSMQKVTAQPTLGTSDLALLEVPYPDPAIQRAIGNKVRKAERLRELAAHWTQVAHAKMDDQSVEFDKDPAQSNWIALHDLNSRLDTQPYRTHFLSLHKALNGSSAAPLSKLAGVSGGDPVSSDEFSDKGVPLVRIRDIQPTGFAAPDMHVSESYFSSKPQCAAKQSRIVMGMDGEFRAQFFIESDLPRFINQRVAIIDSKTIRPELLVAWLNRAEGQMQLARWTVQTTVAHTSLSDIRELLIPRLPDDEEEWLADAFLRARKARAEAVLLIDAARSAVEALVDGTLDEPALLAEGEAIEQWLSENPSPHDTEKP